MNEQVSRYRSFADFYPSYLAGHYACEKNRPATLQYPLYSPMGDCVMFIDMPVRRADF